MPVPAASSPPRERARSVRLVALLGLLLLVSAPLRALELWVGAASSLREVVAESARAFEARRPQLRVRVSYGASSVLAAQVRAGAPLDLLLSADEQIVADLARERRVALHRPLARNRLVVVAGPDAPPLHGPADLAAADIRRIAVPQYAVPVGRYAREWLARHQLLEVLEPRIVATEHARATLVAVDQGLVDAAIVYTTDAPLARRARVAFPIPEAEQPDILYAGAVLSTAREGALARDFLLFVSEGPGRACFARAGFAPPGTP